MSKLRIIRERKASIECEQDLRGLGDSSIITKTDIEPYIVFNTSDLNNSNQALHELLDMYNSKIIFTSVTTKFGQSTKVVSTLTHTNYKISCLFLFNLSIHLIQKKFTNSIDLNETNWLHLELQNAIVGKKNADLPKYIKSNNLQNGLLISPIFSHTLHQAGYKIQPSMQNTTLNENEISEILVYLKNTNSIKNKNVRSA